MVDGLGALAWSASSVVDDATWGALTAVVLDASGVGIVMLDGDLRYTVVNAVAAEINGVAAADHIGRTVMEVLPDLDSGFEAVLRGIVETGEPLLGFELTGQTPAQPGVTRSWLVNHIPIRVDGAVSGIGVVFAETTEVRRAERRLRDLIDGLFSFVGLLSPDGTLLEANRTALEAADLEAGDVLGKPFWDAYWWSYSTDTQALVRDTVAAAAAGRASRFDVDVRVAGGRMITIDFQVVPVVEDGVVTALVPSGLDVTDRVAATAESAALAHLAREMNAAGNPEEVARLAAAEAAAVVGGCFANVALVDESEQRMRIFNPPGLPTDLADAWTTVPLHGTTPFHVVLRTGEPVLLADQRDRERRYPELVAPSAQLGFEATAAMPLRRSDGSVLGVLGVAWDAQRPPSQRSPDQLRAVADLVAQGMERTRLSQVRHDLALELQRQLLEQNPRIDGVDIAVSYRPATDGIGFGGDWYDLHRLSATETAVIVGDVVGHGVEAAARMTRIQALLETLIRQGTPLERILDRAHSLLPDRHLGYVATAVIAVIDHQARRVRYVRAGHPPPLLRHGDGRVERLEGGHQPVLGWPPAEVPVGTAQFPLGAVLVLYSDGVIERRHQVIDEGVERAARLLSAAQDATPAGIVAVFERSLEAQPQRDDAVIVAISLE